MPHVASPEMCAPVRGAETSHQSSSGGPPWQLGGPRTREVWRVLLVEKDARDAVPLTQDLRRHGHQVISVDTGEKALREFADADLVLLDLELPDLDGLEVCRAIRSVSDTPIIAVTRRSSELDRVLGLQAGSDDYLGKPYGFRELMARMEAVMRRARPRAPLSEVISHGPLCVDARTRSVLLHGSRVTVTRKEFDLLYLLASQPRNVVPRRQILQRVWSDTMAGRSRTLDTHVNSLRNKLGSADWIVTVRGVGFQLGHG